MIIQHTNEEAERKNVPFVNKNEMHAFIGLLILFGVNEDTGVS